MPDAKLKLPESETVSPKVIVPTLVVRLYNVFPAEIKVPVASMAKVEPELAVTLPATKVTEPETVRVLLVPKVRVLV